MPQYRVELSGNNRAGCKDSICSKEKIKITKGELRFGTWVEIQDHGSWSWKHWGCVSGSQLQNLQEEDADIQEKVRRCVKQAHIDPEDFKGDPEKNRPGEKGIHLTAKQKAAKEAEEAKMAETAKEAEPAKEAETAKEAEPAKDTEAAQESEAAKEAAAAETEGEKSEDVKSAEAKPEDVKSAEAKSEDTKPKATAKRGRKKAEANDGVEKDEPKAKKAKSAETAKADKTDKPAPATKSRGRTAASAEDGSGDEEKEDKPAPEKPKTKTTKASAKAAETKSSTKGKRSSTEKAVDQKPSAKKKPAPREGLRRSARTAKA
ncbi:hypothetical protein E4U09_004937 [Claviceps aff. purpurea]|uniref:PARP-type domain-containing protein n=1 Tax=Claviceps aff. purpurea TaxID=1967640 RepID=A0A9P7QM15_9HYPO|nr:hypothetical protein E4U09_004937 [Claviceps aff. purpurea]